MSCLLRLVWDFRCISSDVRVREEGRCAEGVCLGSVWVGEVSWAVSVPAGCSYVATFRWYEV